MSKNGKNGRGKINGTWKAIPVGKELSLEQIHTGLLSVSETVEGVKSDLAETQKESKKARMDVQILRDDVRVLTENVKLIPAIKEMLADILVRLPD